MVTRIEEYDRDWSRPLYENALLIATTKDDPRMLVVFPGNEQGYEEREMAAAVFEGTHGEKDMEEVCEDIEFDYDGKSYAFPALYLPQIALEEGKEVALPEPLLLKEMAEENWFAHLHSEEGWNNLMPRVEKALVEREADQAKQDVHNREQLLMQEKPANAISLDGLDATKHLANSADKPIRLS